MYIRAAKKMPNNTKCNTIIHKVGKILALFKTDYTTLLF